MSRAPIDSISGTQIDLPHRPCVISYLGHKFIPTSKRSLLDIICKKKKKTFSTIPQKVILESVELTRKMLRSTLHLFTYKMMKNHQRELFTCIEPQLCDLLNFIE